MKYNINQAQKQWLTKSLTAKRLKFETYRNEINAVIGNMSPDMQKLSRSTFEFYGGQIGAINDLLQILKIGETTQEEFQEVRCRAMLIITGKSNL